MFLSFAVPANNPNNPINLTSSIIVSGLASISTASPTQPSAPFVVTYDVSDLSIPPNKAQTARRRVQVHGCNECYVCMFKFHQHYIKNNSDFITFSLRAGCLWWG